MLRDTEKLRIGVVGAGWFASRRHLPELTSAPDAEVVALCRRDPERLAQMAAHFQVPHTYRSFEEMLDREPLDGLLIATPHNLHYSQAKAALERGIPVLLEKPMALTGAEATELKELAQKRELPLVIALNPPYWPYANLVRAVLASERAGKLEAITLSWQGNGEFVFGRAPLPDSLPGVVPPTLFRADPVANGGGYFMDGGHHLISEVLWTSGLRCRRVQAMMDSAPDDMAAAVSLELEGGVLASITTRADSAHPERRIHSHYFCSGLTLHVAGVPMTLTERSHGIVPEVVTQEPEMPPVTTPVRNFLDSIHGTAQPLSNADHGLQVTRVVEAVYRSAISGRTVEL
ncbi:MAG TPA: Gfo/Idh/MocA family oxidoreductase [Armatimonadota bacterium]|jgi:predicted dehydrogenase